ncbi:hypothetical protein MKW92_050634, partial [Papaver armeniacum]
LFCLAIPMCCSFTDRTRGDPVLEGACPRLFDSQEFHSAIKLFTLLKLNKP